MIENLACLRREIENDTGQPIGYLRLNAAALLDDVCRALGLEEAQIRYVLGSGYSEVSLVEDYSAPLIFSSSEVEHGIAC